MKLIRSGNPAGNGWRGGSVAIRKQVFGSVTITPSLRVCYKKEQFLSRVRVPSQTSVTTATISKSLAVAKFVSEKFVPSPDFP